MNFEHDISRHHNFTGSLRMDSRRSRPIDLSGAELEFGVHHLKIVAGSLGLINPNSRLANGHLSLISSERPNLLSNKLKIFWRNLEFEIVMLSIQELSADAELKLKFIARLIQHDKAAVYS
jgi:hypothetical protein